MLLIEIPQEKSQGIKLYTAQCIIITIMKFKYVKFNQENLNCIEIMHSKAKSYVVKLIVESDIYYKIYTKMIDSHKINFSKIKMKIK